MGICRKLNTKSKSEINMLARYEQRNNIRTNISGIIQLASSKKLTEEEQKQQVFKNEQDFDFIEILNSEIINHCHVHYEKDIKLAKISFDDVDSRGNNSELVGSVTKYVLHTLGLEKAVVYVDPSSTKLMSDLKKNKYEDLGEYDGSIIFMREKTSNKGQMTNEITK